MKYNCQQSLYMCQTPLIVYMYDGYIGFVLTSLPFFLSLCWRRYAFFLLFLQNNSLLPENHSSSSMKGNNSGSDDDFELLQPISLCKRRRRLNLSVSDENVSERRMKLLLYKVLIKAASCGCWCMAYLVFALSWWTVDCMQCRHCKISRVWLSLAKKSNRDKLCVVMI